MHEWALAEAVIATARKAATDERMTAVTEIAVKLGELQQIEQESFAFALQQIMAQEKSLLQQAKIALEIEKALFKCRVCAQEWSFAAAGLNEEVSEAIHFIPEMAHAYMRCPQCQSPDFEVIKGRGVWLASLRGAQ